MKTHELFEAVTILPEWVKSENDAFRQVLKEYGFECRLKPKQRGKGAEFGRTLNTIDEWQFGGDIKNIASVEDLPIEIRMKGLQHDMAKYMLVLSKKHETVAILDFRMINSWGFSTRNRFIYPGDTLPMIEDLVKERLHLERSHRDTRQLQIWFAFRVEPKKVEKPKVEKPRVLRVVKKAT
jgi:hypothetical protein